MASPSEQCSSAMAESAVDPSRIADALEIGTRMMEFANLIDDVCSEAVTELLALVSAWPNRGCA